MSSTLYQTWNHRYAGTATIEWTDDDGAHSASVSSSTNSGLLSHLDLSAVDPQDRRGATLDLEVHDLATELAAAMNAQTAQTVAVTFSQVTLAYTITVTGAVFTALNFSGSAGTLMRRLLGFSLSLSPSAGSVTSDQTPWYIWRAAIDGRAQYDQPAMAADQISHAFADDGTMYSVGPTRPVREARWAHMFEAKADIHRRFSGADDWTAEDFLEHAAQNAAVCIIVDSVESMVFYCGTGFDRGAFGRSRVDSDLHQLVRIAAQRIVGYLP